MIICCGHVLSLQFKFEAHSANVSSNRSLPHDRGRRFGKGRPDAVTDKNAKQGRAIYNKPRSVELPGFSTQYWLICSLRQRCFTAGPALRHGHAGSSMHVVNLISEILTQQPCNQFIRLIEAPPVTQRLT